MTDKRLEEIRETIFMLGTGGDPAFDIPNDDVAYLLGLIGPQVDELLDLVDTQAKQIKRLDGFLESAETLNGQLTTDNIKKNKQIIEGREIVEDELRVMETQRVSMITTGRIAGLELIDKQIKKRLAWLKVTG